MPSAIQTAGQLAEIDMDYTIDKVACSLSFQGRWPTLRLKLFLDEMRGNKTSKIWD